VNILFLFLDGVGLGSDDPDKNPLVRAKMPVLLEILKGNQMIASTLGDEARPYVTSRSTLIALDACLGVDRVPQSATGQATLLTGKNIPKILGCHYGPKPNPEIAELLETETIFTVLKENGKRAALLNAYPQGYFEAIDRGQRLPGAIAMASIMAGIHLKNTDDLFAGKAISADFTAQGWRDHLGLPETPLLSPRMAGNLLAILGKSYDFSIFEYWLSDVAGHRRNMETACELLEIFDASLGGLLESWDVTDGLILLTSDHGNLEDLSSRRHTRNPVPALLIGEKDIRQKIASDLHDLTDVTPAILKLLEIG
jgi:2,3-bisphosphoglycerate-independent phosphoglycerate mutase